MKNIFIGFYPWKSLFYNLFNNSIFLTNKKNPKKFKKIIKNNKKYNVYIWGHKVSHFYKKIFNENNITPIRSEDGFIRSFGLGSDFIPPKSVVFDRLGIYYDSNFISELEKILNNIFLTKFNKVKIKQLIKNIIVNNITKYNCDNIHKKKDISNNKKKILIPGQVANDASIQYGTFKYQNDLELIKKVRKDNKDSFIIYKPHPDILAKNKKGFNILEVEKLIDYFANNISIQNCLNLVDEVHSMTSLVGFDALIRGKKVFTYGAPFYAGWGLTIDMDKSSPAFKRRKRKLTLEELVYGCLIKYPIYWDYEKNKRTTCEHVIKQIIKERDAYWKVNTKSPIEKNYLLRQFNKIKILTASYLKF